MQLNFTEEILLKKKKHMCVCMHDTHRERETHTQRCLKGILLSNEEKNRCDP